MDINAVTLEAIILTNHVQSTNVYDQWETGDWYGRLYLKPGDIIYGRCRLRTPGHNSSMANEGVFSGQTKSINYYTLTLLLETVLWDQKVRKMRFGILK